MLGFITNIQHAKVKATQLKANEGPVPSPINSGASRPTKIPIHHEDYVEWNIQYEGEDSRQVIPENKLTTVVEGPMDDVKYKVLEERLRVMEGFNIFGFDAVETCLAPDVVIPPKFKAHDF